jgi:hypothetical protein
LNRPETVAQEHLRRRREQREDAAVAAIPERVHGRERRTAQAVARLTVRACTAAQLRRVVWPWQERPERTRTPRGRQGVKLVQA